MERKHNPKIVSTAKMLRKNMTKEERHLWYDYLRTHPVRFSRQKVLGKYIADFYSAQARLVIELEAAVTIRKKQDSMMLSEQHFWKLMVLLLFAFPIMKLLATFGVFVIT